MSQFSKFYGSKKELVFVGGLLAILVVLFTPIPAGMLDILLILNLSFALGILTLTIFTDKPVSFSTFPSILLIATLFRLSLNIAATRLILDGAHAGDVIDSVGSYVVGGNFVIGLVVFFILIVVQYVVVTNGAQRIAEVAARFTLDSMPGKQMSIDADLNMGIIDHQQANERRKEVEKEASFYGAMDGASKFVKGDAIAGIIIILIDIIGGLTIGLAQQGMEWGEALHTYTLLTVGDGIVTQIPALVISVATGIIVTRAASDGELGNEIFDQVARHPKSIVLVMFSLLILALLPSMPLLPILVVFVGLGLLLYFLRDKTAEYEEEENLYDFISSDVLTVVVTSEFMEHMGQAWFEDKIKAIKRDYAERLGLVIPDVTLLVSDKIRTTYEVQFHGARLASADLKLGFTLGVVPSDDSFIVEGDQVKDPAFGLSAIWLADDRIEEARRFNYTLIESHSVFITHLSEIMRQNITDFVDRSYIELLLMKAREKHASLVEEVIPERMSASRFTTLIKKMISENIPVKSVARIIEIVADINTTEISDEQVFEVVRQGMSLHVCAELITDNRLRVIAMGTELERSLIESVASQPSSSGLSMKPEDFDLFMRKAMSLTDSMIKSGQKPVILTAPLIRKNVQEALSRAVPGISVISTKEIPKGVSLEAIDILK